MRFQMRIAVVIRADDEEKAQEALGDWLNRYFEDTDGRGAVDGPIVDAWMLRGIERIEEAQKGT